MEDLQVLLDKLKKKPGRLLDLSTALMCIVVYKTVHDDGTMEDALSSLGSKFLDDPDDADMKNLLRQPIMEHIVAQLCSGKGTQPKLRFDVCHAILKLDYPSAAVAEYMFQYWKTLWPDKTENPNIAVVKKLIMNTRQRALKDSANQTGKRGRVSHTKKADNLQKKLKHFGSSYQPPLVVPPPLADSSELDTDAILVTQDSTRNNMLNDDDFPLCDYLLEHNNPFWVTMGHGDDLIATGELNWDTTLPH